MKSFSTFLRQHMASLGQPLYQHCMLRMQKRFLCDSFLLSEKYDIEQLEFHLRKQQQASSIDEQGKDKDTTFDEHAEDDDVSIS